MVPHSPFRRALPRGWRPRRLLVIKACCIGDAVMTTPALAALRSSYPFARIDVAVGRWTRVVYEQLPQIDRLVDLGEMIGGARPPVMHFLGLARQIADQRYDGALVMERSLWFGLLPALAGIPVRIGFDSGGRGFTHTIPIDIGGIRHEADRYLDVVTAAGARKTGAPMTFEPSETAFAAAAAIIATHDLQDRSFAILHPGGGSNPGMRLLAKRWPVHQFVEIARKLIDAGIHPVAIWGPGEEELGEALRRTGVVAIGDVALPVLGALASHASIYLGNDTGPSHIATASGVRTVIVFGPTDERRYGPYGTRHDGTPAGETVADPTLDPEALAEEWLDRSIESVSTDSVWNAIDRALNHATSGPRSPVRS